MVSSCGLLAPPGGGVAIPIRTEVCELGSLTCYVDGVNRVN